jgi:hypothetical protein
MGTLRGTGKYLSAEKVWVDLAAAAIFVSGTTYIVGCLKMIKFNANGGK